MSRGRQSPTSAAAIIPRVRGQKTSRTLGTALEKQRLVTWRFGKRERKAIYSGDGISRYKRTLAFGHNVCFPNVFESSENSAGKMILAETIRPAREQTASQTRPSQRAIHWSRESILVPKCKELTHAATRHRYPLNYVG